MSNTIKRITNKAAAAEAINLMVESMSGMWADFATDGKIQKNSWGLHINVTFTDTDGEASATSAYLHRCGDTHLCILDFYTDEQGCTGTATDGNEYSVNEYGEMVEAD